MKLKTTFGILLGIMLLATNLSAQVTIGSIEKPIDGALLDLKEFNVSGELTNATKGLLLPRVNLEKKTDLAPCVRDLSSGDIQKEQHTGLVVYNVATVIPEELCPGIYTWNAKEWVRINDICDELEFENVAATYVMDGQEYSFKLNTFNSWTAEIVSDPNNIINSIISPLSGTSAADYDFKFKINIKTDTNSSATIKFTTSTGREKTVTINGEIPIITVTPNVAVSVDASAGYDFSYSSNSTLPLSVVSNSNWVTIDNDKIKVADNTTAAIKTGSLTVSNGAATPQNVTITQPALTLSLSTAGMTAHVDGQAIGYTYSSNSKRVPLITSSDGSWLTANTNAVYTTMTYSTAARTGYVYATIGGVSRAITVSQPAFIFGVANAAAVGFASTGGGHNPGFTTNTANYAARGIGISAPSWMTADYGSIYATPNSGVFRNGNVVYYCNNRGSITIPVAQHANFVFYSMKGTYGQMDAGNGGDGVLLPKNAAVTFEIQLDVTNTGYNVYVVSGISNLISCTISGKVATVTVAASSGAGGDHFQIFFGFTDPSLWGSRRVYNIRRTRLPIGG